MMVGYARISTAEQASGLEAQERDLRAAGAERVMREQASSASRRSALEGAMASLQSNDVLLVTGPDRLARNMVDLLAIIGELARRGIGLIVLSLGGSRLDTRDPASKPILTILDGIATWERVIVRERQREGIAKAKSEGKYKGRNPTVALQAEQIRQLHADGERPAIIARKLQIARSSVYRLLGAAVRHQVTQGIEAPMQIAVVEPPKGEGQSIEQARKADRLARRQWRQNSLGIKGQT